MKFIETNLLKKHNVIKDIFDYQGFDESIVKIYIQFENVFKDLFTSYSEIYEIRDCCFYISENISCNAFALRKRGYHIIAITNGYAILISEKFQNNIFNNISSVSLLSDEGIQNAYYTLKNCSDFNYSDFLLNCSIHFTFGHEFRHILQFIHDKMNHSEYNFNENCQEEIFDIKKHAWEFDADRAASCQVISYVFNTYRKLKLID